MFEHCYEEISIKYGVPVDRISCPACGKIYRGKVCLECEECSKCCSCEKPDLAPANKIKTLISTVDPDISLKELWLNANGQID